MDRARRRAARIRDADGRGDQAADRRAEAGPRPRRRHAAIARLGGAQGRPAQGRQEERRRARRRPGAAAARLSALGHARSLSQCPADAGHFRPCRARAAPTGGPGDVRPVAEWAQRKRFSNNGNKYSYKLMFGAVAAVAMLRRDNFGVHGNVGTLFRNRRHTRSGQQVPDDRRDGHEGRHGGGQVVPARQSSASRRGRQGHAAVRLHARKRDGGGLLRSRYGCLPARADPDAGGGDAGALAARGHRRDDFGLAQSLPRQRHQAVRPGRLQAVRRDRGPHRSDARRRDGGGARRPGWARPSQAHRRRA